MTRSAAFLGILGFIAALGCATEEPEDATSTAASSVGMSNGSTDDGSSDSSGASGGLVVDYETDVQPVWNGFCTCHLMGGSGTMTAPFMTLNPGVSLAELVGVPSEQSALNRIEAGSTEQSYLWLKLTGAHTASGEGDPMPPTGTLEEEQLEIIEAWILSGAAP